MCMASMYVRAFAALSIYGDPPRDGEPANQSVLVQSLQVGITVRLRVKLRTRRVSCRGPPHTHTHTQYTIYYI